MNQTERIKKHLLSGKPLTPLAALKQFGCLRLGARIYDLKRQGINIAVKLIAKDGKRFAQYRAVI